VQFFSEDLSELPKVTQLFLEGAVLFSVF